MTQADGSQPPFIPLVDLGAQHASIRAELDAALAAVLDKGDFIGGGAVGRFEAAFARYCGVGRSVGCGNGTDAIELACRGLGIGPGDEVVVPAMTFAATALGVMAAGATPVLAEVTDDACLLDPAAAEAAITERTKALFPVHLYGTIADMEALSALCDERGLLLLEDAAQAHGAWAEQGGLTGAAARPRAGSFGDAACFSFYPSKNLGALGDGGAVVTDDEALADRIAVIRNIGAKEKYVHELVGVNSRLDTLHAAALEVKLAHLDGWNARRRELAARYDEALAGVAGLELTRTEPGSVHHLYVVRHEERDRALEALKEAGIGAGLHYPRALHEHPAIAALGYRAGQFPIAERWARRCLSLPIYAEMPEEAVARSAAVLASL